MNFKKYAKMILKYLKITLDFILYGLRLACVPLVLVVLFVYINPDFNFMRPPWLKNTYHVKYALLSHGIYSPPFEQQSSCPIEENTAENFPVVSSNYKPKVKSFLHELLDDESSVARIKPQMHADIDNILSEADRSLPNMPNDLTPEQSVTFAENIFPKIDCLLIRHNFVYPGDGGVTLLSDSLTPFNYRNENNYERLYITPANFRRREFISKNKSKLFSVADCDIASYYYLGIAAIKHYPVHLVIAPGHAFVRWTADKRHYVNFETTIGYDRWFFILPNDDSNVNSNFNIPGDFLGSHGYLSALSQEEMYAEHWYTIEYAASFQRNAKAIMRSMNQALKLAPNNHTIRADVLNLSAVDHIQEPENGAYYDPKLGIEQARQAQFLLHSYANLNTLACGYAETHQFDLAVAIDGEAVNEASHEKILNVVPRVDSFRRKLPCQRLTAKDPDDFRNLLER